MSKAKIAGWVMCGLLALLFTGSAVAKLMMTAEQFSKMPDSGWKLNQIYVVGIIELACVALFIIPTRLSFIGLVLLTAYMGGAVATHVRIDELPIPQVIIGVLLWIAYSLAHPEVFMAAFRIAPKKSAPQA